MATAKGIKFNRGGYHGYVLAGATAAPAGIIDARLPHADRGVVIPVVTAVLIGGVSHSAALAALLGWR